ncbi:MAG: hypothetical protein AB7S26_34585 [Sandaracinaceae bacterium]
MSEAWIADCRVCTALTLPSVTDAIRLATSERADNLVPATVTAGVDMALRAATHATPRPASAVLWTRLWAPGRTLRVSWVGSAPEEVREAIRRVAERWMEDANLRFEFIRDGVGDLRIANRIGQGSWSYVGTDALGVEPSKPTMSFGWLTPSSSADEYRRVVLHVFGHALGCLHEHMHPAALIPWDRERVYAYYARTQGWDRASVEQHIFQRYARSSLNGSEHDPDSIMSYPVSAALTVGAFEVAWNDDLSERDRAFIRACYP